MTTDAADWADAIAGSGEAFGRIFDRHRDRVARHSVRLVPTRADADDVVAITFLEAWRKRTSVRFVDDSLLPWLLVAATHSAQNVSRGARRYRALLARLPAVAPVPDHAESIGEGNAVRALRMLSLLDREVIVLCVLEGLSEREAASALGVAPGTVKSRLSRAKARLAGQLDPPSTATLAEEAGND
jgi:RNA polymerase sigma-70 factor (ECF subfamily)